MPENGSDATTRYHDEDDVESSGLENQENKGLGDVPARDGRALTTIHMRFLYSSRIETRIRFLKARRCRGTRTGSSGDRGRSAALSVRPGPDAVTFEKAERTPSRLWSIEASGNWRRSFLLTMIEETSASSGTLYLAHAQDFIYRKQPSSDAISLHGYVGTEVNFAAAMLAVTLHDRTLWRCGARFAMERSPRARLDARESIRTRTLSTTWRSNGDSISIPIPLNFFRWSNNWREFVQKFSGEFRNRDWNE